MGMVMAVDSNVLQGIDLGGYDAASVATKQAPPAEVVTEPLDAILRNVFRGLVGNVGVALRNGGAGKSVDHACYIFLPYHMSVGSIGSKRHLKVVSTMLAGLSKIVPVI
jgi:hypothetical protein